MPVVVYSFPDENLLTLHQLFSARRCRYAIWQCVRSMRWIRLPWQHLLLIVCWIVERLFHVDVSLPLPSIVRIVVFLRRTLCLTTFDQILFMLYVHTQLAHTSHGKQGHCCHLSIPQHIIDAPELWQCRCNTNHLHIAQMSPERKQNRNRKKKIEWK